MSVVKSRVSVPHRANLLLYVNCKYNKNGNYFENNKLNDTEVTLQERNNN